MVAGVFSRDMLDWKNRLGEGPRWAEPGQAPPLPREMDPEQVSVFRTDFSIESCWLGMIGDVDRANGESGGAEVNFVDDPSLRDMDVETLRRRASDDRHDYFFVFDRVACSGEGYPVLVVSTCAEDAPWMFRASADSIPVLDTNLGLGNVQFEEFAAAVEDDGVYR
jgi:hypothetical protein